MSTGSSTSGDDDDTDADSDYESSKKRTRKGPPGKSSSTQLRPSSPAAASKISTPSRADNFDLKEATRSSGA